MAVEGDHGGDVLRRVQPVPDLHGELPADRRHRRPPSRGPGHLRALTPLQVRLHFPLG